MKIIEVKFIVDSKPPPNKMDYVYMYILLDTYMHIFGTKKMLATHENYYLWKF